MFRSFPTFATLTLTLAAAPTLAQPGAQAGAPTASTQSPTVTQRILYTTDATGNFLADLYTPAGAGPFPALLLIHGGSWRSGSRSELRRLAHDLTAHGYVCLSIDYDVRPRSFPWSWQESRAAVQFLRDHAADYHLDPNRIGALGTSAGGQLAALLAVAPEGPTTPTPAQPVTTPGLIPIEAAVLFNGGYDAHPRAWVLRRYLGGSCDQIPAVCKDASPDDHIRPGAPPIFVGHGTRDHLIPYSQATTFIALLQKAGDPVTPFAATGAHHSYWRSHHWYAPNLTAAEAFLDANLRPNTPPQPTP